MITKPMKAPTKKTDTSKLTFPLLCSPKVDGIRCLQLGGLKSSTLKKIPNLFTNSELEGLLEDGMDGELEVGGTFNTTTSGIMKKLGEPDFCYNIFDWVHEGDIDEPYNLRIERLRDWGIGAEHPRIKLILPIMIHDLPSLEAYLERCLADGYEGAMLRDPLGRYKCGRSTEKEGLLLKLKPFEDAEGVVVGFEEQMENRNPVTIDALGRSVRSSHKSGMVPKGTLGKFVLRGEFKGKEIVFRCGGGKGLDRALRQEIWDNRAAYLGRLVKYKYQAIGSVDAPRIPQWVGFRDERDM